MVKNIIILGGHIQALGLCRQAKGVGLNVVLMLPDRWSVAKFSNTVNKIHICENDKELQENIFKYASETKSTLLFPTNDYYVEYLHKNRTELEFSFQLALPSPECIEIFANKRFTFEFSKKHAINHPACWCPNDMNDVRVISETIQFPIVVKPAIMYIFHKKFGKKAFLCHNKEELINRCEFISKSYQIKDIILQEFLVGGPKHLFSYGVFAVDGEPKAWIVVNRIRQNPMDFGNSTTFAVKCSVPEIEIQAKKILSLTNFTGLAEIEFMYDVKTGAYKFLEINTRAWKWHNISLADNYGFLSELIHYLNGENSDFEITEKTFGWVEHLTDIAVSIKEILKGRMKIKELYIFYKHKKINAVWCLKDPIPALMYIVLSPILFIKRR